MQEAVVKTFLGKAAARGGILPGGRPAQSSPRGGGEWGNAPEMLHWKTELFFKFFFFFFFCFRATLWLYGNSWESFGAECFH